MHVPLESVVEQYGLGIPGEEYPANWAVGTILCRIKTSVKNAKVLEDRFINKGWSVNNKDSNFNTGYKIGNNCINFIYIR
jgi:hypothetical protein